MGLSLFDETYPTNSVDIINNAFGTAIRTLNPSQSGACRIDQIWLVNNDAIPHVVGLYYNQSGGNSRMGGVSVPAGAGIGGTPGIELLSSVLGALNGGIVLTSADGVGWGVDVAMVTTSTLQVTILGGQL